MLIDLSTSNRDFAGLLSRTYPENRFYGIKHKILSPKCQESLNEIYKAITGEDILPDDTSVGFTVKNGMFHRMYGPCIYRVVKNNEHNLNVKWGDKLLKFSINRKLQVIWDNPSEWVKTESTAPHEDGYSRELAATVTEAEINGYKTICLQVEVTLFKDDKVHDSHILNIPFRFVDINPEMDSTLFRTKLKTDYNAAIELISEPITGSNFVKAYELNVGRYQIVGIVKHKSKKTGEYSIQVNLASGESIWLPNGMVNDVVGFPDDANGWLSITEVNPTEKTVKGTIQFGENSALPFKLDPPVQHLKHLGVGSYDMTGYYMPANSEYGTYVVILGNLGRYYCPKSGLAHPILNAVPVITPNNPATFVVEKCEEKSENKWSITANIILQQSDEDLLDLI